MAEGGKGFPQRDEGLTETLLKSNFCPLRVDLILERVRRDFTVRLWFGLDLSQW